MGKGLNLIQVETQEVLTYNIVFTLVCLLDLT